MYPNNETGGVQWFKDLQNKQVFHELYTSEHDDFDWLDWAANVQVASCSFDDPSKRFQAGVAQEHRKWFHKHN